MERLLNFLPAKPQPVWVRYESSDVDGCFEVACELVVSGGDTSPILEPAEHALDEVTPLIGLSVEWVLSLSRRIVGDDRDRATLAQKEAKAVAVISGISGAQACRWQPGQKRQNEAEIAALSWCYLDGERPAPAIDNGVDFGRAATARAPDRLFLRPPFPPAAER